MTLIWKLVELAGPCKRALRARVWRLAQLGVTHKSGATDCVDNLRLLQIRDVMGLLQEACLALSMKPSIQCQLQRGQSGYTKGRSPYDPHLVLHELARMTLDDGRCLWMTLGDFWKAYPSVCRNDLLLKVHRILNTRGGCRSLLEECMKENLVVVFLSGGRTVNLLPDSLISLLHERGCGVAPTMHMPLAWVGRATKHSHRNAHQLVAFGWTSPML